jgi:hypothetical protein
VADCQQQQQPDPRAHPQTEQVRQHTQQLPQAQPQASTQAHTCTQEQTEGMEFWRTAKSMIEGHWGDWKRKRSGAADCSDSDWFLLPRKLIWIFARLRATGVLSGETCVALLRQWSPKLRAKVADNIVEIDEHVRKHHNQLRPALENLLCIVATTPELESCAAGLSAVLDGNASAGETLLTLLKALDTLSVDKRIVIADAVLSAVQPHLFELLDKADAATPAAFKFTFEHSFVVCDGCGTTPILGPRFKCKECPDFDLCSACFARTEHADGAQDKYADFECHLMDWLRKYDGHDPCAAMMIAMKGFKGMCKGKGKFGKGKGKYKGVWADGV